MRVATIALPLAVLVAVSACTASYNRQDTGGTASKGTVLDPSKAVLIAVPADGNYQGKPFPGSGMTVAQQTAAALSQYAKRIDTVESKELRGQLDIARQGSFGYLVVPIIAHWEQRATEWSGRPSKTSVSVSVYDAQSGEKIQSSTLDARSRIVSFTSTSPESLLPDLLRGYASELYGGRPVGQ